MGMLPLEHLLILAYAQMSATTRGFENFMCDVYVGGKVRVAKFMMS